MVAGCVSSLFPKISGDKTFPSNCWAIAITTTTNIALVGESNKAITTAGAPPKKRSKIGDDIRYRNN